MASSRNVETDETGAMGEQDKNPRVNTKGRIRVRSKNDRLVRTIVLGAVTLLVGLIWLSEELGMNRDELLDYMTTSLLFVGLSIGLALAAGGLVWLVKKLLG